MKILAKQIDEQTKQLNGIFNGTDYSWANENGFIEYEAEQGYDGQWYLQGYAPKKPDPTKEEISELREQAYIKEVDILHAQKMRKTVLGTWTEEDEANYIAEVKRLSEDIANRYPYPEETVTEFVEEQLELPLEV